VPSKKSPSSTPSKSGTAAKRPPATATRPSGGSLGPVIDQMGPRLRAEFEHLQKSESKILRALKQPETAKAFAADPLGTLTGLGVSVPPIIKQRLKAAPLTGDAPDLLQAKAFRLPNGQVVTANVTIRFTGTPKEG
jgi:hypothetical protein